jgi:hypothetical protein
VNTHSPVLLGEFAKAADKHCSISFAHLVTHVPRSGAAPRRVTRIDPVSLRLQLPLCADAGETGYAVQEACRFLQTANAALAPLSPASGGCP